MEPVHFTLSEQAMIAAQRDWWRGAASWKKIAKGCAILWFFYLVFMLILGWTSDGDVSIQDAIGMAVLSLLVTIAVVAIIHIGSYLLTPYFARKAWRQHLAIRAPTSVSWDDKVIVIDNEYGRSQLPWSGFVGWHDGRDNVLLYQSDRLFNMLPKTEFSEALQAEVIAHLKAANVPRKYGLGRSR
ncbi:YcxB family protein [Alterisphingorhabdus coralli]|uniref:YcxB family protein n=1 Tax=Alterisphingorhabdus coralli TaxID=3071408 RepID=A0AA97F870_9SPHN|nr:YcxB family protein [Parasphingorhabdus sp. SCSIO 66989]WOE75276.1 YcxB family protein [Parasphingorhabdus sp. SCSIO 66989]